MQVFKSNLILITFLGLLLFQACQQKKDKKYVDILPTKDCLACERIALFYKAKDLVSTSVWNGLIDPPFNPPVLYFTDSTTYITTSNDNYFNKSEYVTVICNTEDTLYKLNQRLDSVPFHMENKMSFKDSSSLFYYRPMMLCSDVETMHQFVPDFKSTEEWLQLVMHEYFHSFQFSYKNTINYLADSIQIAADTLDNIYLNDNWFQKEIEKENKMLLNAIESENKDSIIWFVNKFQEHRINRRLKFQASSKFNLAKTENFWETIEGTARYAEYYMALHYTDIRIDHFETCDSLFQGFANYLDNESIEKTKEFRTRTEIMPAYYYATGFNMCRLMDKIGIEYKASLFNRPEHGLYNILIEQIDRIKNSVTGKAEDDSNHISQKNLSAKEDFDFYIGSWEVKNERKMDDGTWKKFKASVEVHKTLNGFGNVDFFVANIDGKPYEGMTVRQYDSNTNSWHIRWYDSDNPMSKPLPSVGKFQNGQGFFYKTIKTENGKEVKVRFYWYDIKANSFKWESSWSIDGINWNPTWKMQFKRIK